MSIETVLINGVISSTNYGTTATVSNLVATDAALAVATGIKVNVDVHVEFASPVEPLIVGADLQTIEVYAERTTANTGIPTLRIELWDNGSLVRAGTEQSVAAGPNLYTFTFNGNELANGGINAQVKCFGTWAGTNKKENSVNIDSIIWAAETGIVVQTATLAGQVANTYSSNIPLNDAPTDTYYNFSNTSGVKISLNTTVTLSGDFTMYYTGTCLDWVAIGDMAAFSDIADVFFLRAESDLRIKFKNDGLTDQSEYGSYPDDELEHTITVTRISGVIYYDLDGADLGSDVITNADVIIEQLGATGASPAERWNGVLKNMGIIGTVNGVPDTHLFWPINDGWAANPVIAEVNGDGTFDGTALLFDELSWTEGVAVQTATLTGQVVNTYADQLDSSRFTDGILTGQVANTYADAFVPTRHTSAVLTGQIANTYAEQIIATKQSVTQTATLTGQVVNTYADPLDPSRFTDGILAGQVSYTYADAFVPSRHTSAVITGQVGYSYSDSVDTARFTDANLTGQITSTYSDPLDTARFTDANLTGQITSTYSDQIIATKQAVTQTAILTGQVVNTYASTIETNRYSAIPWINRIVLSMPEIGAQTQTATLKGQVANTHTDLLSSSRYTVTTLTGQIGTTYAVALDAVKNTVATLTGQVVKTYSGVITSARSTTVNLIGQVAKTYSKGPSTTKYTEAILYGSIARTYASVMYGYSDTVTYNPNNIKTVSVTEKYNTNSTTVKYSTMTIMFDTVTVSVTIDTVTTSDTTNYTTIKE